jgi:hypothetical protein
MQQCVLYLVPTKCRFLRRALCQVLAEAALKGLTVDRKGAFITPDSNDQIIVVFCPPRGGFRESVYRS